MRCPRHRKGLATVHLDHASVFDCPDCGGRAATMPLLRRMLSPERAMELWKRVRTGAAGRLECPSCGHRMHVAQVGPDGAVVEIDGCPTCQVLWFDPGELRAVTPRADRPRPAEDGALPSERPERWEWGPLFDALSEKRFRTTL